MASEALAIAFEAIRAQKEAAQQNVSIVEMREQMEQMQGNLPLDQDVRVSPVEPGEIKAEWVTRPESSGLRIVLYFHGGGYAMGSPNTHRELCSRIASEGQARVLNVDYRLAPEHPYPAAIDDAFASYRWLLGQDVDPHCIVVAGDSAGGGLSLALLLRLRAEGLPLPAGAALLSPWTDLTGNGDSVTHRANLDPMIDPAGLTSIAREYYGEADPTDPLISPRYGNFEGLPPLLIQVGGAEILFDDSLRVAEEAEALGVEVSLQVWEEAFHVFQAVPVLPEAIDALRKIGAFIQRVTS